jgi:DNA helicase-2/ATP-dependent DNA helicase PcrA
MLNKEQRALVQADRGLVLCIAGAGSGKTHSIMAKIKYTIEHQGIHPHEILAVTFTKKAANEMKDRIVKTIGVRGQDVNIGTLNSFCAKEIINFDPHYFGYTRRPLIALEGYEAFLKEILIKEDKSVVKELGEVMDYHLTRCLPLPKDYGIESAEDATIKEWDISQLYEDMRKYQIDHNRITFTDQIYFGYCRLRDDEKFRYKLGSRYKLVIVDEAQDNNYMQNHIVLWLGSVHNNIVAVGDDAQSIYRFRGADAQYFLDLHQKENFRLLTLTENFRSYQPILDLGNAVLRPNFKAKVQIEKNLVAARSSKYADKPQFAQFPLLVQETEFIAKQISGYKRAGHSYSDVAILCRSVLGGQGRFVQGMLRKLHIPYQVVGGIDIAKSIHVKRMLSAFAIACDYKVMDDWVEILKILPRVGEAKGRRLVQIIQQQGWDAAIAKAPVDARDGMGAIKLMMKELKANLAKPFTCYSIFSQWYISCLEMQPSLDGYSIQMASSNLDLIGRALDGHSLEAAIENIKLDAELVDTDNSGTEHEKDCVTISTVHRAKGLEWPFVIIPDCHHKMFPHKRARSEEDIQEECRIFHVAVTRAKDKLILTMAPVDPSSTVSPFIDSKYVRFY